MRLMTGEVLALPEEADPPDRSSDGKIILGIRPQHLKRAQASALPEGHVRIKAVADLIQPTGTRPMSRLGSAASR